MRHSYNINFPELTFTSPGKYLYTMKELTPSSEMWETDKRTYRIIVTVTEGTDGKLVVSLDYPDGLPKFVNKAHCCPPPKPHCNPCKYFNCIPFPMFWFVPPQKAEFMKLAKKFPQMLENDWWKKFFEGIK